MTEFEGYDELAVLHRSARSTVYRARASDGQRVVVKTGDATRLQAEYQLLSSLDLPGIVRARELVGGKALVLEEAGTQNLAEWLRDRTVGLHEFLRLAIQLAEIVARLHQRGIVHLELNPWNILVDTDLGWLTVCDFAHATRNPVQLKPTIRDRADQALAYIAPEQTGRMNRGVDHRADLYALGCTFYEMLTSAPPFLSDDELGIVHAHLAKAPRPPKELEPNIPEQLSDVVMHLLAKTPEERYQSAEALQADLLRARRTWSRRGSSAPAVQDRGQELLFPAKLYGRDQESKRLLEAFEQARSGRRGEVMVVTGPAGIGKSALATSLIEPVHQADGHLALAKFDQLRGKAPYASLGAAIGQILDGILQGTVVLRELWRSRVGKALEGRAPALVEVLPQLEQLLGEQPVAPQLGPAETRHRFEQALHCLLQALAGPDHPLVLVLDDLQWADQPSLTFTRLLARRPPTNLLLLINTRDAAPVSADQLELQPLQREHIAELVADALRTTENEARALADLIEQKAGGNAFFVRSMLRHLHAAEYIRHDPESGWTWDLEKIANLSLIGSADELMEAAILRLDPPVRELLQVAACVGNQGSLSLLVDLLGVEPTELGSDLQIALDENLLTTIGASNSGYRFSHDQVQRAAISTLNPAHRAAIHLCAGLTLLERAANLLDEHIFDIVDQLERGRALITLPEDRERFAELNLIAARRARRNSAYEPARDYLLRARAALPRPSFEIELILAEACHLSGDSREGDRAVVRALALARDDIDRAEACRMQAVSRTLAGEYADALDWGRQGLAHLGFSLRSSDRQAVEALLGEDPVAQITDAPRMEDRRLLAIAQLLADMATPSYFTDPPTFGALMTALVRLSLEEGNSHHAPYGYVFYGMMLAEHGFRIEGHKVGLAAIRMAQEEGDPASLARVLHTFANHLNHWVEPVRSDQAIFDRALRVGLEAGELRFTAYAAVGRALAMLSSGAELDAVLIAADSAAERARQVRDGAMLDISTAIVQFVRCMQGRTHQPGSFEDDDFSESEFLIASSSNPTVAALYDILRLKASVLLGLWEEALVSADAARPRLGFVRGLMSQADYHLYAGLAFVAKGDPSRARDCLEQLRAWEATCPANFRHKAELLTAELSRYEGNQVKAMEAYGRAAEAARTEGFAHEAGLANDLASRFHGEQGRRRISRMYSSSAERAMRRWGAGGSERNDPTARLGTLHGGPSTLDMVSVLKAAEVISSEVVLERLIDKLMQVCMEAAGAERAVLMLEHEGLPIVRAIGFVGQRATSAEIPVEPGGPVSYEMVMEARRRAEPVVLDDAMNVGLYREDPYTREHRLRSVMVLPIRRQSTLVGVFWFENNLVSGAFTKARLQVLRLLSTQIASSLENSLLFEQLMSEIRERAVAERKLRRSELRLKALFERAPDVFVLWDPTTGKVTQVNDAARKLVGTGLTGLTFVELFTSPGSAERLLEECKEYGRAEGVELELVRRAAGAIPVLVNASLVTDGKRALYGQAVVRDIRPLKAAEEALVQANESLEERVRQRTQELREANEQLATSNEDLRQFAYLASHDLKSPIRAVSNYLQLLKRRYNEVLDETGLDYIDKATGGAVRMQTLIDDVLAFSQVGQDRRPFTAVKIERVVTMVLQDLQPQLTEADGKVEVLGSLPQIFGNEPRLIQLFQNLFENAVKYRGETPPRIIVSAKEKGPMWEFSVKDNGIGIEAEYGRRIFVIFKRLHNRSEYSGTGIGLAMCKKIVELHGGSIWVESQGEGTGSDFRFTLLHGRPHDEAR